MTQCWHPRAGRGQDYTLWDDSLLDAMARVGLSRESIYEQPPSEPKGFSLDADRMKLFTDASPGADTILEEGVRFLALRPVCFHGLVFFVLCAGFQFGVCGFLQWCNLGLA